ncbi:MAG: cytochrome c [Desulfobulbaceae bacterium]|nr:cytochrome c [Desulfobulbaceae bacterium]
MKPKLTTLAPAALMAALLGLTALATQDRVVAAESETAAQSDPMQFAKGAKTWADTCTRCHNMRDARSLRDDQWRVAVAHMRVRAGLTATEAANVLAFLQQTN